MIDIHTHILPGLDDGAETWDYAIRMARAAAAEGVTDLIATPHHGIYTNHASAVLERTALLNERLRAEGVPLVVHAGQEIRVSGDLLDDWDRGKLLTLAGSRYMLVEMPHSCVPSGLADLFHELAVMGITPILAHPERNGEILLHPEKLDELLELGAYAQVTTHSLLGSFGPRVEKLSWHLCRSGKIHFIASDAHNLLNRDFRMKEAFDLIGKELGEEWKAYFLDNARRVLANEELAPAPSEGKAARGMYGVWRGLSSS